VRILSGLRRSVVKELVKKWSRRGSLYGTTYTGGVGTVSGVVFELKAK
jgi:hypothetical protein